MLPTSEKEVILALLSHTGCSYLPEQFTTFLGKKYDIYIILDLTCKMG